jgi:hypothetical protein
MSPIHGAYAVHRWMFWLRKAGRKVALEVQPNCQGPMYSMCIPSFRMLVVPGTFSVSCLPGFRNGLTSTPMLGCPGEGVFWSWFSSTKSGRFSHENIFNQDVFVRKEENWAWQLYVILGFYNVILCFGLYFSIHTKKSNLILKNGTNPCLDGIFTWVLATGPLMWWRGLFRENIQYMIT